MVVLGISMFIVGFLITVSVLSSTGASVTNDADRTIAGGIEQPTAQVNYALITGLMLSLAGVVSATVGPAVIFLSRKRVG